jgi:hypothetical protein
MTSLVACLTSGQGTWTDVLRLVAAHDWDQVFLVATPFARQQLQIRKEIEFIMIDEQMGVSQMSDAIRQRLHGKISGFEVAVNLSSGTGREHMALISAILKNGLALRLVELDDKGVVEV